MKHQRQQLSDSQNLLQSLRVELQVYEKIKTGTHTGTHTSPVSQRVLVSVQVSLGPEIPMGALTHFPFLQSLFRKLRVLALVLALVLYRWTWGSC